MKYIFLLKGEKRSSSGKNKTEEGNNHEGGL
jgi:hypothetical protein